VLVQRVGGKRLVLSGGYRIDLFNFYNYRVHPTSVINASASKNQGDCSQRDSIKRLWSYRFWIGVFENEPGVFIEAPEGPVSVTRIGLLWPSVSRVRAVSALLCTSQGWYLGSYGEMLWCWLL
jgi:hypothetical protein